MTSQRHSPRRPAAPPDRRPTWSRRCASGCPRWPTQTVAASSPRCPSYAGALQRRDGRQHRGRRADGARRLPQAGRAAAGRPTRSTPLGPAARGRLRARPRRGAQRARDGRPAGGLPGRRAGGLARAGRDRRRRPGCARDDDGAVRRAGLRLHRRAVRGQRGRAHRRAGDHRPGPASATCERLAPAAARAAPADDALVAAAERADWAPPDDADRGAAARPRRCAACSPRSARRPCRSARTCPGVEDGDEQLALLLVPDAARRAAGGTCCGCSRGRAGRGRPARPWARGAVVVRPGAADRRAGRRRRGTGAAGRHRGPPGRAGRSARTRRRSPTCAPGCSRPLAEPAPGTPPSGSPRRCAPGCCTRAAARRSPPSCTCTRRRCATGWASCASCTATGSTTRRTVLELVVALTENASGRTPQKQGTP